MTNDNMNKVKEIIGNEDSRNPLSDNEIAQRLSILRETVSNCRCELKILNSRERRKPAIIEAIKSIKTKDVDINLKLLTFNLNRLGFDVSKNYVSKILNDCDNNNNSPETNEDLQEYNSNNSFSKLVGFDGSLKKCITRAIASISYPPFGLPTLIIGESGTGKTLFAEFMYRYALQQKIVKENAPFKVLNCADYGDNPQLLLSILYGHKKGSFTGADNDTVGLVENANNGVLFLDEIHRLPPKGQEMLFSLLDRGQFRRLGETSNERKVNIFFIGATTENIDSSLLVSFRRRIPMLISVPSLNVRPIRERIQLINSFFQEECNRINCKIFIDGKIIKTFALKNYRGNVGQLRSEIQVVCANAYVENINNIKGEMNIGFNEILYNNFFGDETNSNNNSLSEINISLNDNVFIPKINDNNIIKDTKYSLPEDIYVKIEEKYNELKKLHMSLDEMNKILWIFILDNFNKIGSDSKESSDFNDLDNFKYIISDKIIVILENFLKNLKLKYPNKTINKRLILNLGMHINEAIKRIRFNSEIYNPNIIYIKEKIKVEFNLACELVIELEKEEKVKIPEDETCFIAMYIKELLKTKHKKDKIGLIILCHGKVATEMVNVVNKLMDVDFPIAIDMPLDVSPSKIFEKTIEISKILNNGGGILFLSDMGSLINVGDIVNKRTGIETRTIDRVDLLTVLDAVRKVYIAEESLDDIYYSLINSKYKVPMVSFNDSKKPSALIAMCLTGRGIAIKIRDELAAKYEDVSIINLGLLDDDLNQNIDNLKKKYNIVAIVGTINPGIDGIKFIPFDGNFIKDNKNYFDCILKQKHYYNLKNLLNEDLIMLDLKCKSKQEVIKKICMLLFNKGYVKKEYLNSVLERENLNSTYFKGNIGIPHGLAVYLNTSCLVFATMKDEIVWDEDGRKVKFICIPAINNNDSDAVTDLFKMLKQPEIVSGLLAAKSQSEFINIIQNTNL
ncbi:sigma 54-interacting transcriptional regulator [Clostridium estertheticum]|uniref:sigma 54-interacting transcriptional regulator n=1 Tax=Clostridium estertheticum TaxID=238834 RepID=UPI001C0D9453|nr:sigma 54-interacting transcriptional regulator [Clostridium estertheticum]MBU3218424.1 sigma 54-interacting transcriptional regulator [Clostridium estertheticum]WAG54311.1 sigma 54-interacting transcriptional regulator [Clostridium estertheticum]